jgi:predicted acetyltransferase
MPKVQVLIASDAHRAAVGNLFQLYVHDFSEQWAGRPEGELQDDGRFGLDDSLADYWTRPGHVPLIVTVDGRLAGFALLDDETHSGLAADRNMAEFFIVRKHRRLGVGTTVAHAIFAAHPGQWEVAVARRNLGAIGFWRRAIGAFAEACGIEERDVASPAWDGPIIRFRSSPPD